MNCDACRVLISGRLDGELTPDQQRDLEAHLASCDACRRELDEMARLKEDLAMMRFTEPGDDELRRYWARVYNRLERGLGWVLASLGAILLLSYGGVKLVEHVVSNPAVSFVLRTGVVLLIVGLVVLFVSILRERLTVRCVDRYAKEIDR